jgi:hypothetical protein
MIKMGIAYNVINNETLQIEDLDNGELYEVKGEKLDIDDIREELENGMKTSGLFIEYNDETMEMVV